MSVGPRRDGPGDLYRFGFTPLIDSDDKHSLGEFVNIIQHPEGDYKQVVLRENRLVSRLETVLHYMADTQPGSSGSPVFNDQWEAVALHHWGEPFRQTTDAAGHLLSTDMNEGIRISAIVKSLNIQCSSLTLAASALLNDALRAQARQPFAPPKAEQAQPVNRITRKGLPDRELDAQDQVIWTIPIEVSVRLGASRPCH